MKLQDMDSDKFRSELIDALGACFAIDLAALIFKELGVDHSVKEWSDAADARGKAAMNELRRRLDEKQ